MHSLCLHVTRLLGRAPTLGAIKMARHIQRVRCRQCGAVVWEQVSVPNTATKLREITAAAANHRAVCKPLEADKWAIR